MVKYGVWAGNPKGVPEDKSKCIEEVGEDYVYYQCQRSRGHGKDELYCEQHALRYPEDKEYPIKYAAKWEYGRPYLTSCGVIKETPKTFTAKKEEGILGSIYFSTRTNKKDVKLFDTQDGAVDYLMKIALSKVISAQETVEKAEQMVLELDRLKLK